VFELAEWPSITQMEDYQNLLSEKQTATLTHRIAIVGGIYI
jgi:hypothetical protein